MAQIWLKSFDLIPCELRQQQISVYLALNLINISNNDIIYTEEIFLIMMLPGIDMLRLFIIRITNKKNPFKPDKHHLHHLLSNKLNSNIKTLLVLLLI